MNLDVALSIAVQAHAGQVDKAGEPYILHPLRLMSKFDNRILQIISVLHDVVEDSEYTLEDLKTSGFNDEVLDAIDHLTKREGENYTSFISRVKANHLARLVKVADIKDNLDISRLHTPLSDEDLKRVRKYHDALNELLK